MLRCGVQSEERDVVVGLEPRQTATCSLCLVQFARYTCPRCNVQYCSLDCYKSEKHAQCSEDFYRECFMTELQSQKISVAEKRKMMEILRKAGEEGLEEEEGRGEEGDCASLEERLAGVHLDAESPESVWSRLTRAEQDQFRAAMSSGHLSSLIPLHTPWWRVMKPVVAVDEAGETDTDPVPDILPNLPPLHTLVKDGKASPLVRYSILNVLYAYAFTVRLYNGDHRNLPVEAAQTVLDVSSCLSENTSYSMAGEAITHAVTTVQQSKELASSGEMAVSVMEDVSCILCGPQPLSHCTAPQALSDLHRLLSTAAKQIHSVKGSKKDIKVVKMACKKVYFLTVWAVQNVEDLQYLARLVDIEHGTSRKSWKPVSTNLHPSDTTKSELITEIS